MEMALDERCDEVIRGERGLENALAVELDRVLPTARGDAHCGRLTFGQFLEVVLELGVEHLFRGRDVEWIKAAGADEDLRDRSSPDIMKAEEPDPGIRVDRPAGEVPAMFELAEDNAVKVKIEVQTVWLQLAISDSGDGRID
jgi:hypothetical protein